MLTATITISLNDGSLQYTSSDPNTVLVTGSGSGTRLRLLPLPDDMSFTLTFTKGTAVDSLDSFTTPATAFGGGVILPDDAGDLVMVCNVLEPYQDWAFATNLGYTSNGVSLLHDPTIVFNPPSNDQVAQPAAAPVAAELAMA